MLVAGQDIAGKDTAEICRQVGYLPQDPNALLFADTVLDELLATLRNFAGQGGRKRGGGHKPVSDDQKAAALALLERLGLGSLASAYPRDLSAGERQRVALGAVTVTHPAALLLDEPTRGLDYAAKRGLAALLRGWRDEGGPSGMAILLVTHDVELAAQAADRAILMEAGRVTADGPAQQVLGQSALFAPQVARLFPGQDWPHS